MSSTEKEGEMIDGDGNVLHMDNNQLGANWKGHDFQSGIQSYLVGIGTSPAEPDTSGFINFGTETSGIIKTCNYNIIQ